MTERYEIVEITIGSGRTFAVLAWNDHTCLGADAHWLTREAAERAMAEYAAGTRRHGAPRSYQASTTCPDCSTGRPVCRFYDDHPGPHRKPRAGGTYV